MSGGVESSIIELTIGQRVGGKVVHFLLVVFFIGSSIHILTHLDIAFHIIVTISVAAAGVAHSKAVEVIEAVGTLGHLPFRSNAVVVKNGREQVVNGVSFKIVSTQFSFRVHAQWEYGDTTGFTGVINKFHLAVVGRNSDFVDAGSSLHDELLSCTRH